MTVEILIADPVAQRRGKLADQLREINQFRIHESDGTDLTGNAIIDVVLIAHDPDDAFMIARTFQTQAVAPALILLATTGSEQLAVKAWRQGFSDYLAYPLEGRMVYEAVMRALDRSIQRRITTDTQRQLLTANLELTHYLQALDKIVVVGKAITADLFREDVLRKLAETATEIMQSDHAGIVLKDAGIADWPEQTPQLLNAELAYQVMAVGQPIIISSEADREFPKADLAKSLAYVPLFSGRTVVGVLGVENYHSETVISTWQVTLLRLLAEFGSVALHNADTYLHTRFERDMLKAILDGTEEPVMVVDTTGCLFRCNPAARNAFNIPEDYLGPAVDIIQNDDIRGMLETGIMRQIEITLDDERVYQAQMTAIDDVGYVIVMQEITHLKDLDRLKTNFVASISQDLRSPLTAIMGYVELLGQAGPVNDLQKMFIDRITLSAQTISDEINDLLDLSRIESSSAEMNYEFVQLPVLVDYALATVEGQLAAKQLNLSLNLEEDLPLVWGNAQRLKQMIRNLLENAIMFTPEQGAIYITLKRQTDLLMLKISDTGIGIPLEDQPHIFDKFYRAESVREEYEGAGLGLAIVKSILDRHQGRIWVESQPDVGSAFSLLLPIGMECQPRLEAETVEFDLAVT